MSREMKDSGDERIGFIPYNWDLVKLKYVIECNRKSLSETTPESYTFRYIDIGSVSLENGIERYETYSFSNAPSRARRMVDNGDVIVSTVRTYLKAIAKVNDDDNVIASTGFAVLTPQKINAGFLEYACKSHYFTENVTAESTGISYPAINSSRIINLKIAIPSKENQKKIAEILDIRISNIDKIIKKTKSTIEDYKLLKQSIITEAVTKGLDKNVEMKDSGIEWIGEIPKNWKVVSSSSIFSNSKERAVLEDEKLSATQSHGVLPQSLFEELVGRQVVSVNKNYENLKKVCENDFVISLRSFQGGIEMSRYNGAISAAYTILKPNKGVNPEFFKFLFKSGAFIQAIQSTIIESVREGKSVSFSDFKLIKLPLLSFEEQIDIAEYLDVRESKIDKLIEKKENLVSELEIYKKSLIYEYVTGKKEVL